MTIYDHITRDQEMASRTRAALDELRSLVAKLEVQLADARSDFDALDDAAAAVVRAHADGGWRLDEAIEAMRDGGFDGWWEKTDATREPPSIALRARLAAVEAERDGALAQCEELTQSLRETQRARDAAAQAFDDLVATVWRAATGDEHEPPGSTGALVEAVQALRSAADSVVCAQIDCDDPRDVQGARPGALRPRGEDGCDECETTGRVVAEEGE